MKIFIIGGPGSGKTTLATKLSKELGIPHHELDNLEWDDSEGKHGIKRDPRERYKLFNDILSQDNWIIEGVYVTWSARCFKEADKIYLLDVPAYKCRYRVLKRYLLKKLGIEKGRKESLRSMFRLLNWAGKYRRTYLERIRNTLKIYSDKVVEL